MPAETPMQPYPYKNEDGIQAVGDFNVPDPLNVTTLQVNGSETLGSSTMFSNGDLVNDTIWGNLTVYGTITGNVIGSTIGPHFTATDGTNQFRVQNTMDSSFDFQQTSTSNPVFNFKNASGATNESTVNAGTFTASTPSTGSAYIQQTNTTANVNAEAGFRAVNDSGTTFDSVITSSSGSKRGIIRTSSDAFGIDVDSQGSSKSIRLMTNATERVTVNDSGLTTDFQITSTVADGTTPFLVTSKTQVSNLNSSQLEGATWESPLSLGSTNPNSAKFTFLNTEGPVEDTSTPANGDAPTFYANEFHAPILSALNTNVTTEFAFNVYIPGAPTPGTNQNSEFAETSWFALGVEGGIQTDSVDVTGDITIIGATDIGGELTVAGKVTIPYVTSLPAGQGQLELGTSLVIDSNTSNAATPSILVNSTYDTDNGNTSVVVKGGLGVSKTIYGGSLLSLYQTSGQSLTVSSTTDSTAVTNGSVVLDGGIGIAKSIYTGGPIFSKMTVDINSGQALKIDSNQDNASATVVTGGSAYTAGGLGVAKSINYGTTLNSIQATGQSIIIASTTDNSVISMLPVSFGGAIQSNGGIGSLKTINAANGFNQTDSTQPSGLTVASTTDATSATAASITTAGGIGAVGTIYSNGKLISANVTDATLSNTPLASISTNGGIYAAKGIIAGGAEGSSGTVTPAAALQVVSTLDSTSITTGSTIIDGGIGVAKAMFVGGKANFADTTDNSVSNSPPASVTIAGGVRVALSVLAESTTVSTSTTTGAIVTPGGVGIGGALWVGAAINTNSITDSTSPSTGSIITPGGVGIGKTLYVPTANLGYSTVSGVSPTLVVTSTATTSNGNMLFAGGSVLKFATGSTINSDMDRNQIRYWNSGGTQIDAQLDNTGLTVSHGAGITLNDSGEINASTTTITTSTFTSSNVSITGGTISGLSSLSTASLTTEDATISGGTINDTAVGDVVPAEGYFTVLHGGTDTIGTVTGSFSTMSAEEKSASLLRRISIMQKWSSPRLEKHIKRVLAGAIERKDVNQLNAIKKYFEATKKYIALSSGSVTTPDATITGGSINDTVIGTSLAYDPSGDFTNIHTREQDDDETTEEEDGELTVIAGGILTTGVLIIKGTFPMSGDALVEAGSMTITETGVEDIGPEAIVEVTGTVEVDGELDVEGTLTAAAIIGTGIIIGTGTVTTMSTGSQLVDLEITDTGSTAQSLIVDSAYDSTSITTGSALFKGGVAITKNLYVGGNLNVTGTISGGVYNASELLGNTWAIPAAIGGTTPNNGIFTNVTVNNGTTTINNGLLTVGNPGPLWFTPAEGLYASSISVSQSSGSLGGSFRLTADGGSNNVYFESSNHAQTYGANLYFTGPPGSPTYMTMTAASTGAASDVTFAGTVHVTGSITGSNSISGSTLSSTTTVTGNTLVSTVSSGTAPLTVASNTNVANLNASLLNGSTFANPGPIGTTPSTIQGTVFTSTASIGTAPLVVTSTTNVPNLNASSLNGATFASPGTIGGTTPGAGTFTNLVVNNNATYPYGLITVGNPGSLWFGPTSGLYTNQVIISNRTTTGSAMTIGTDGSNDNAYFESSNYAGNGGANFYWTGPSGSPTYLNMNFTAATGAASSTSFSGSVNITGSLTVSGGITGTTSYTGVTAPTMNITNTTGNTTQIQSTANSTSPTDTTASVYTNGGISVAGQLSANQILNKSSGSTVFTADSSSGSGYAAYTAYNTSSGTMYVGQDGSGLNGTAGRGVIQTNSSLPIYIFPGGTGAAEFSTTAVSLLLPTTISSSVTVNYSSSTVGYVPYMTILNPSTSSAGSYPSILLGETTASGHAAQIAYSTIIGAGQLALGINGGTPAYIDFAGNISSTGFKSIGGNATALNTGTWTPAFSGTSNYTYTTLSSSGSWSIIGNIAIITFSTIFTINTIASNSPIILSGLPSQIQSGGSSRGGSFSVFRVQGLNGTTSYTPELSTSPWGYFVVDGQHNVIDFNTITTSGNSQITGTLTYSLV